MPSIDDFMPPAEPEEVAPRKGLPTLPGGFPPTEEQAVIAYAALESNDNLLIDALAGAAKTSTLVLIDLVLPKVPKLCLAFNTRIAKEMSERMSSITKCKTLNSVGHQAWANYLNKRFLQVDDKKTWRLVKEAIEATGNPEEKKFLYSRMSDLMRAVDYGKTAGWVPDGHFPIAKPLMDDMEFFASLEEEPTIAEKELIIDVSLASLHEAHEGLIDFSDQLLCPTVFPASFTQYPLTLVDEAQDMSALNHVMLRKIVGKKRVIAVGDPCQSIYGFRGAHQDSMDLLQQQFSMDRLVLSVSFRCPVEVVKAAQWRAPHMRWPEWAKPGKVSTLALWDVEDIPDFGVILCRNNAPLFSMAIKLLKAGRYPELVGNDLGKGLLKILRGLDKDLSLPQQQVIDTIMEWKEAKLKKARNKDRVHDQVECLLIFARQGKTLGDAIAYCEHILSVAGPIKLMTGHKSKGLEFDDVFILDQALLKDDQQDKNLRYVMQTRAKSTLTYITSEGFAEPATPEPTND